jgi:hypothetical protein
VNEERLASLLRLADASARPPPATTSDMAQRVVTLARRRNRRRHVIGGVTTVFIAAVLTAFWDARQERLSPANLTHTALKAADAAALRAELGRLEREADLRLWIVRRTRALKQQFERDDNERRGWGALDALAEARLSDEQAAFALLAEARRQELELALRAPAIASYQQVVAVFPNSAGAAAARERLALLNAPTR